MAKKQVAHHGKSYGICTKCSKEFKLRRKTKHNYSKKPKGVCPACGLFASRQKSSAKQPQ